jgi:hypothetical protein
MGRWRVVRCRRVRMISLKCLGWFPGAAVHYSAQREARCFFAQRSIAGSSNP